MTGSPPIGFFKGAYSFLSNFYRCDVQIAPRDLLLDPRESDEVEGYPTAEHAFQAGKTRDPVERRQIRAADIPSRAKGLGRRATLRPDWEEVKFDVMVAVLRAKFADPEMREKLLSTGERLLVEGNTWGDREWGSVDGRGENKLGKALMKVRSELSAAGRPAVTG